MRDPISDLARVQHIMGAILEIEQYLTNAGLEEFKANSMLRYACVKQLEIIGEAANHLSQRFTTLYNEIEWKDIVRFRNILVHEYFDIDVKTVWEILQIDIPPLKTNVSEILKQLQ